MTRTLEFLKTILTIILFTTLPLVVLTLVTSKTGVLMGLRSFVVLSGSMQPTIPVGSVVFVQKQPNYQLGDVVSFKESSDIVVTHRVSQTLIKGGQILYRTKGDANNSVDDKLIPSGEILGKEVLVVPYIGRISALLKTMPGFVGLIILPTLLFIAAEVWNIKNELEREIEKKLRRQNDGTKNYRRDFYANSPEPKIVNLIV